MCRSSLACLVALTALVGCNTILGLDESRFVGEDTGQGGIDARLDASAGRRVDGTDGASTSTLPSDEGTAGDEVSSAPSDASAGAAGAVSDGAADSRGGARDSAPQISEDAAGTGGARDSGEAAGDAAAGGHRGGGTGAGGAGGTGAGTGGAGGAGGTGAGGAGGASAGTGGASTGGRGGGGYGGTDGGCFEPTSSCSGDLSGVGTGDFEIKFTLTTTATHRTEIIDQRDTCGHSYFWDVELVDGALQFETDDNDAHYTVCLGSTLVNDGKPHRVVARRRNERLEIAVDCALDAACASHTDFSTVLPSLRTTSPCSSNPDPPIALVGTLLDVCIAGVAGSTIPRNGLVGEWLFDEGDARDTSGNALTSTVQGATLSSDRFGRANHAFHFDGVSQNVMVAPAAPLHFGGDHTISAWIRPAGFSYLAGIVSKYQSATPGGFMLRMGAGAPYDTLDFDQNGESSQRITANQWQHAAGVMQNGTVTIYLQGAPILTTQSAFNPPANDNSMGIGVDYAERFFYGDIDDVRVYNRALSAAEIAVLAGS